MVWSYLQNIVQLILSPSKAWEDIAASMEDTDKLMHHLMYPMMVLASLTVYVQMIYNPDLYFTVQTVKAVVVFVSLFLTFFFARIMLRSFAHSLCEQEISHRKEVTVLAYIMSLLALATTLCNLLPVNIGLKYLLPLGVAMVMWKADIYLRVKPDRDFAFIFFVLAIVIVPPIVIQQLFDLILT